SKNNYVPNQYDVIVLSDTDEKPKIIDSKIIKIDADTNTFNTSSKNNYILNQHDVIVLSNADEKPILDSTSNSFILDYKDLQISDSLESEYNSDFSLENNSILVNDLEYDNILNPDNTKKTFGISNIQYAYGDPGTIRSIKKCPFLGVPVQKTYRLYHSVK
ncbi:18915_t:CDS:2, partial [Gigaspora rosea]